MDIEGRHLLAKTLPDPLASAPVFSEDTEGPRSSHQMWLKWNEVPVLGPNIPNQYLIEVAQYPGNNWQTLGVNKKAPYNQVGLKDFYSLNPYLEYQYRVIVGNIHGISAAELHRHPCLANMATYFSLDPAKCWGESRNI